MGGGLQTLANINSRIALALASPPIDSPAAVVAPTLKPGGAMSGGLLGAMAR
jgi:hypothetical protein